MKNLVTNDIGSIKYDQSYVETCSEIELYRLVNKFYEPIRRNNYYKSMINFYTKNNDFKTVKYFENLLKENSHIKTEDPEYLKSLFFCIAQTSRFNTNVINNGQVTLTKEFKNWYESWETYIATMDDITLQIYRKCCYEGKGFEYFSLNKTISTETDLNNIEEINYLKAYGYVPKQKSIKRISA